MPDRRFVIDTSLFVNPISREKFGKNPTNAVKSFIKIVKKKKKLEFFMPPSIFAELRNFIDQKTFDEFELYVKKRTPNTHSSTIPASVFYDFIDDIRTRLNKGLRIAEDFAKDNHPDNDAKLAKLRDKYRDALRSGILDSQEDFELVLLSKEIDATLVTADEGALKFANQLGCTILDAKKLFQFLKRKDL